MSLTKLMILVSHNFRLAFSYKLNFASRYIGAGVSILLFYFLDRFVRDSGDNLVNGGTYFTFLLIGGAFSRYLEVVNHGFTENLREEMLKGTIEPLLATATPTVVALVGPSSWRLIEGAILIVIQLSVGALVGAVFSSANWISAAVVILVSLTSLLSYGIFSTAFLVIYKRGDPLNWVVNAVSYVLSGVFFPIDLLPIWLRVFSYMLPFTYSLRALRGAMMRGASLAELGNDLLILLGFTAILLPLSLLYMRYAIQRLKQRGELVHY